MSLMEELYIEHEAAKLRALVANGISTFLDEVGGVGDEARQRRAIAEALTFRGIIAQETWRTEARAKAEALWPADEGFDAVRTADLPGAQELAQSVERGEAALAEWQDDKASDDADELPDEAFDELEEMIAEPEAEAAPVERRAGPIDDHERQIILDMTADGKPAKEIAAALNRSPMGFGMTVKRVLAAVEEAEAGGDEEAAEDDDEGSEGAQFKYCPPHGSPSAVFDLHQALNDVGYPAPWSPRADLRLVNILTGGGTIHDVAGALNVSPGEVKARWNVLLPVRGLDEQKRLMAAVGLRSDAWAAQQAS